MTKEEAFLYLGGDEENLFDEYEQQLFDFKQYFLTKPVVSKLYQAQFKRMSLLEQAGKVLGFEKELKEVEFSFSTYSGEILLSFSQFESEKALLKSNIINSKSVGELISFAKALLTVQENYFNLWPISEELNLEGIVIGKEPDPMELLNDIKELSGKGIDRFNDLTISSCETLVTLSNEWKRLSLLRQKEHEWKKASSIN